MTNVVYLAFHLTVYEKVASFYEASSVCSKFFIVFGIKYVNA